MADVFTKKKRSWIMSRIRSKRTRPEMTIHAHLKAAKVRHQMWPDWIEGSPDIVVGLRAVVFVNGCFWHGCARHWKCPKTNARFWRHKVLNNWQRQYDVKRALKKKGWNVVTVWEHELRTLQGTRKVVERLKRL